jgi:hypothetical protein
MLISATEKVIMKAWSVEWGGKGAGLYHVQFYQRITCIQLNPEGIGLLLQDSGFGLTPINVFINKVQT